MKTRSTNLESKHIPPTHADTFNSISTQTIERICKNLESGCSVELALEFSRVSINMYNAWCKAADGGNVQLRDALLKFCECDRKYIMYNLGVIQKHAEKDWRAAERLLAWKRPSNFGGKGTRIKIEQQNTVNMTQTEQIMNISTQVLAQVASGAMNLEDAKIVFAAIEQTRRVAETLGVTERVAQIEQKIKAASNS